MGAIALYAVRLGLPQQDHLAARLPIPEGLMAGGQNKMKGFSVEPSPVGPTSRGRVPRSGKTATDLPKLSRAEGCFESARRRFIFHIG